MKPLHAVLKARYGDNPAGHWVVMRAVIGGVKLFALAFAWSKSGVSYFISTCGKTSPASVMYDTHFEDDFGNIQSRQINRPDIVHFLFEVLPLIDEHNKQRQSILALEKCWPTRDCWFRLLVTVTGMCVVDFLNLYRNIKLGEGCSVPTNDYFEVDKMDIRKFSDLLCAGLRKRPLRAPESLSQFNANNGSIESGLVRITAENGTTTRQVTAKQSQKSRSTGTARQMKCFVCRKYLKPDGSTDYKDTSFCCKNCNMPLCKHDRTQQATEQFLGRPLTCWQEHMTSNEDHIACTGKHVKGQQFPKDKTVNLHVQQN